MFSPFQSLFLSSVYQKRKGLRGSVDLEKIKCVERVQSEPNAPAERMHAFQVEIMSVWKHSSKQAKLSIHQ